MFIIELTYKKPLSEVDIFLDEHRTFLQKYYDKGVFVMSGPKEPRDGGVIIADILSEDINEIIKEDPFYREKIANYNITQFMPNRFHNKIKEIF